MFYIRYILYKKLLIFSHFDSATEASTDVWKQMQVKKFLDS